MARAVEERQRATTHLRELDWLMLITIALASLGLVMAVSVLGSRVDKGPMLAVREHSWKLMFGLVAFLAAAATPMRLLRRLALPGFFVATAACLLPHLFHNSHGAHRWIRIGGMNLQPVEPARFFLVLAVAALLARAGPRLNTFRHGLLPVAGCFGLLAGVLLTQPDHGNALIVVSLASVMAILAGARLVHLVALVIPVAAVAVPLILRHGYVRDRLTSWLHPAPDSQVGLGLLAMSSGGITGRGLGQGWMKMGFVPEAHNDFVFAIIGEELGFLGTAFVVAAFAAFGWTCWRIAVNVRDPFLRYVVCGYSLMIIMQAAANLLVVSGWAPAKGIDLPFISTGGTSLTFCFAAVGLIGNAARADRSGAFASS